MKKLQYILFIAFMPWLLTSCGDDSSSTPPAPQITPSKSTLNLVPFGSEDITVSIVAPGKFSDISATADNGAVTISDKSGADTNAGTATLSYTAPDITGNFKITVVAIDKSNQQVSINIDVAVTAKPPVTVPAGDVFGIWEKGTTIIAEGSLNIPEDKTLTIEEGVTVIFDGDGLQGSPELTVRGKLYSYGTEEHPVVFTIPEAKRIKENIFKGLWGGIQALPTATEVALIYTHIEYAGAIAGVGNPSVDAGIYADGAPRYGFLFSNTNGKLVMQHSRIAYTNDDGMRVIGGTILITNNEYILTGKNGGESLNIKSSVTGDVAYNISWRAATNAYKWSNKSGANPTPQTDVNVYNNTAIECGWRQTKTGRGGSLNIEELGRGQVYNNLNVNCKFGVRVVGSADIANISLGYSQYYSTEQIMVDEYYPSAGVIVSGDKETDKDMKGGLKELDPKFANYDVSSFTSAIGMAVTDAPDYLTNNLQADFKLKADAPGLAKGKTGFSTKYSSLTVDGKVYQVPAPSDFIGAFGKVN
jgi:hypothetical protein